MEERTLGRRYRLTEKIGEGGMAVVYKAQDEVLGRTVAVKIMHPQYAADPTFAARFRQEAQAAANLQSPYIVNMYDWGRDGDTYYIVMEYIRGIDLKSAIEQRGAIDPRKVAEIGAQVCAALTVAHGYDIIHRDIKPHNIMVQPDGNAKVMDFGIARAGNNSMTQTGSVLGTAHYVSPEQAQGLPLTAASDIYSLGVVLYEASTGKVPFDAPEAVAVALKQVNEQPVPPRRLNPQIDPAFESIILKAMSKKPSDRFASAGEMRAAIKAHLAGKPIAAGATAVIPPVPAVAGAASVGRTSVMPAVSAAGGRDEDWDDTRVVGAPVRQAIPEKRPRWPWIVVAAVLVLAVALGAAWATGMFAEKGTAVPDVVGTKVADAKVEIVSAGFKVGKIEERFNKDVAAGLVISQDPTPPATLLAGGTVNLVVSKGQETGSVPDVVGKTEAEAFRILKEAGFDPQPAPDEYSDEVEAGLVMSQVPGAGESAEKGATVNYTVSKGTELVDVPNVTGKAQADATKLLNDAGFDVVVKQEYVDTVEAGIVSNQSPTAGVAAKKGSSVTITVSQGKSTASVPDVVGMKEQDAVKALESRGFKVSVIYEAHANSMTVIDQNPPSGTEVKRGSTIELLVDKGNQ